MTRPVIHIVIHFTAPALIAWLFFRKEFWKVYFIMLAAFLIDLDHLAAVPVYDSGRCSIGFHPLHTLYAIAAYLLLSVIPISRIAGAGLLIHISADIIDCVWMGYF